MQLHNVAIQGPDNGSATLRLIKLIASFGGYNNLLSQFAYATTGGVQLIIDALAAEIPDWVNISKRWLVSIDFGLTEPKALERLLALPNSQIRIPYAHEVLKNKLKPYRCFHSKSMFFYKDNLNTGPTGIYIGSANMTVSGLCYGHENAMAYAWSSFTAKSRKQVRSLMQEALLVEDIYNKSTILDMGILTKYSLLRKTKYVKSEDNTPEVDKIISLLDDHEHKISFSEAAILSTAKHYWVEGGYIVKNRGPKVPGNQIDLPRGASAFFGFPISNQEKNTSIGEIQLNYRKHIGDYPLRLGNNYMEKLSLPIPGAYGPDTYEKTVLLFSKIGNNKYKLEVQPINSQKSERWERKSNSQRTSFTMRGGRKFGVFD
jgi:HKD family nuclease